MASRTRSPASPAAEQVELLDVAIPSAARHPKVRMITRAEIYDDLWDSTDDADDLEEAER